MLSHSWSHQFKITHHQPRDSHKKFAPRHFRRHLERFTNQPVAKNFVFPADLTLPKFKTRMTNGPPRCTETPPTSSKGWLLLPLYDPRSALPRKKKKIPAPIGIVPKKKRLLQPFFFSTSQKQGWGTRVTLRGGRTLFYDRWGDASFGFPQTASVRFSASREIARCVFSFSRRSAATLRRRLLFYEPAPLRKSLLAEFFADRFLWHFAVDGNAVGGTLEARFFGGEHWFTIPCRLSGVKLFTSTIGCVKQLFFLRQCKTYNVSLVFQVGSL